MTNFQKQIRAKRKQLEEKRLQQFFKEIDRELTLEGIDYSKLNDAGMDIVREYVEELYDD